MDGIGYGSGATDAALLVEQVGEHDGVEGGGDAGSGGAQFVVCDGEVQGEGSPRAGVDLLLDTIVVAVHEAGDEPGALGVEDPLSTGWQVLRGAKIGNQTAGNHDRAVVNETIGKHHSGVGDCYVHGVLLC